MQAIRILLLMLFFTSPMAFVMAQRKGVQEGELVPNVAIGHSLNGKEILGAFSDYRGKLVILDFWHTQCSACLRGFPEMARLQKKFGDKIKVFLVTMNTDETVNTLFKRLKPNIGSLSVVTQDTSWNKLFPHLSNPHHVWIGPDGVYRYATFDHNATEENIATFLNQGDVKLSKKQILGFTEGLVFDKANSSFSEFLEKKSTLLKGYFEYSIGKSLLITDDSVTRFPKYLRASGLSPLELLKCANYDKIYGYNPGSYGLRDTSRTVIEVAHPDNLYQPKDKNLIDQWNADNFYGYELTVKAASKNLLFQTMRKELEDVLPYRATIEPRLKRHLALVWNGDKSILKSKGDPGTSFSNRTITLRNAAMSQLIYRLNDGAMISNLPIIDETGIDFTIDFQVNADDFFQLNRLKETLLKFGLNLVEKDEMLPMLVVRDKKKE